MTTKKELCDWLGQFPDETDVFVLMEKVNTYSSTVRYAPLVLDDNVEFYKSTTCAVPNIYFGY